MFRNMKDLVHQAQEQGLSLAGMMMAQELETPGQDKDAIFARMAVQYQVMKQSARRGLEGLRSRSGMTGGDAKLLEEYIQQGPVLGDGLGLRATRYAISVNEVNAAMGVVCASPTAGSCGVLPGVLLAAQEHLDKTDEEMTWALFTAGAVGYVIANNAFVSGAQGGCQAEIGSAAAMAAAALVELAGGNPEQAAHAAAMALKNLLGLVCDPLAGLVEVPCVKRNAGGAAIAVTATHMALADIKSHVPPDEVIEAMYQIGLSLSPTLRETAQGGLAATETGNAWKQQLWNPVPGQEDA